MRLSLATFAVLASLAGAAAAGAGGAAAPPVLTVSWPGSGARLVWRDAATLRPLARSVRLGDAGSLLCRSPDGRTLVFGSSQSALLRFVDVRTMRAAGEVSLGLATPRTCLWSSPSRLLVLLDESTGAQLALVDPTGRRELSRRVVGGSVQGYAPVPGGLAVLLGPPDAVGPSTFARIAADGTVDTVPLPAIRSGFHDSGGDRHLLTQALPGFAISPDGSQGIVVPETGPVAAIDLSTLAVTYHALQARWAESERKTLDGYAREAAWLPSGLVAVTGGRWTTTGSGRSAQVRLAPAGLSLIDTRDWSVRLLDPKVSQLLAGGGRLLGLEQTGAGGAFAVTGFGPGGAATFRLPGSSAAEIVYAAGPYVYLGSADSTRFTVVDGATGLLVGTATTASPTSVVETPGS